MIGQTLSHYKIIDKLGEGGFGEVYLAEDSRLDRKVALKILPQHLSERAELRERFEREARAVSSLNHPHILHSARHRRAGRQLFEPRSTSLKKANSYMLGEIRSDGEAIPISGTSSLS